MKQILILIAIAALTFTSCKKENKAPEEIKNKIVFVAESNTPLSVVTFIDRNRTIIWEETEEASIFRKEIEYKLEPNDKVIVFAMPKDGKHHVIKTQVYIDGVLKKSKTKSVMQVEDVPFNSKSLGFQIGVK